MYGVEGPSPALLALELFCLISYRSVMMHVSFSALVGRLLLAHAKACNVGGQLRSIASAAGLARRHPRASLLVIVARYGQGPVSVAPPVVTTHFSAAFNSSRQLLQRQKRQPTKKLYYQVVTILLNYCMNLDDSLRCAHQLPTHRMTG